ncbi:MAG TPA: hypothetical protein VE035_07070 [Puia sp.]|nr:hypothetical protein [Puia sp.]
MAIRITCIKKEEGPNENPYTAISSFGYVDDRSGETGSLTREAMYNWVLRGGRVYVSDPKDERAYLITQVTHKGTRFVKTRGNGKTWSDGTGEDELLSLGDCE